MAANTGYRGVTQGPIRTRVPGAAYVETSMPITPEEAEAVARFNDGGFGTGFETPETAIRSEAAIRSGAAPFADPDILYSDARSPGLTVSGVGPVTRREAEVLARFNDDGESGFDAPASQAMTAGSKGRAPRQATAQEAAEGLQPMAAQAALGSGRLPNPDVSGQAESDDALDWEDHAKDALYSASTGVAEGAIGLAGLPGDVQGLAKDGARWLARKAGVDPSILKNVYPAILRALPGGALLTAELPTSVDIRDTVEDRFGPLYQPKTSLGRVLHTAGTLAPGALVPGGLVARAANVAVPTLLSEAAGRAAKGTEYESIARAGGAAAGALTPWGITKALQAAPKSAKHAQAVDALKSKGVRSLTAGQELGSKRLQRLERQLGNPAKFEPQNAEFTRAVLKRAGAHGDEATPKVLGKAADGIERDYIDGSRGSLDAFRRADRQKRNLAVVKKAAASGPHPGGKRHITPERLIAGETADNVALGKGNFADLIEAGQTVMAPPAPHALTGHTVRLASSGLGGAIGGVPGAVIGGMFGPSAAGKALMSRPVQSYLRNDLIPQSRWRSTVPKAGYNWTTAWQSQDDPNRNSR